MRRPCRSPTRRPRWRPALSDALRTGLLLAAALAASGIGFGWLALAMDTHWAQVFGPGCGPADAGPAPRAATARRLRALGALALLASLGLCLRADHATMAVLVWVMALAAGAFGTTMLLSWRPRWLGWLVPGAAAAPPPPGQAV